MWVQVLSTLAGCLVATGFYLVTATALKARQALARYKKQSAGLHILDNANPLLANHGVEFHLGRHVCQKLTKWHEQFGETFGFLYGTRPCASTIDLDLIKTIVLDEPQAHLNRMPFNTVVPEFEEDEIFLAEGEQWWRIRRVFGPALRKFKLPHLVEELDESVGKLVQSIECKLDKSNKGSLLSVKLDDLLHRYSLDVVFRCFYKQNKMIDYNASSCEIAAAIDEALCTPFTNRWPVRLALIFPTLRPYLDVLVKNFTQMGRWQLEILRLIREQMILYVRAKRHLQEKQRTKTSNEEFDPDNFKLDDGTQFKRSVMDYITDQCLNGKLTRKEYTNSSFLLFSAADKTVCDAMVHALYFISVNQHVQQKLRHSIMSAGLESEYLTWVINETIRLHPPATVGCSRTITRDIKLADSGHILPTGTYVHTPLYTIHRHQRYWGQDANEFRPERWANADQFHPLQFIAFGSGRRSCPGKELAMFEMKSLLVSLLTRFKFEADEKDDICIFDMPYTLFTVPNSPTFVKVSRL